MKWEMVRINQIAKPSQDKEKVSPFGEFPMVGVRLWGEGCYARDTVKGIDTQYKFFTKAEKGDLVVNKIWARNGAISVIQPELEGYYITPEFPVYKLSDKILPKWMYYYSKYYRLWKDCEDKSRGTSGKNRIKPDQFTQIQIPLPPLPEQQRIVTKLDAVKRNIKDIRRLRAEQERDVKNLLYSKFLDVSKNAPLQRMSDVAPVTRKQIEIKPDGEYPELGVRGFGRGIFHKPTLIGADLTWQKLYEIQAGDLVISNIKAWEGAIAVAKLKDHKRLASHRYLTCKTDETIILPDFLCAYLLYPEGLEKIQLASPGSADRNRTLAVKRLEAITVPTPDLHKQREFIDYQRKINQILSDKNETTNDLNALMPSLLDKAFKGEF